MKPKQIIKHIARRALELEYGFAPALSAITVHESSPDGARILFEVNGKKYRFDSYKTCVDGMDAVYIGPGTISRGWVL